MADCKIPTKPAPVPSTGSAAAVIPSTSRNDIGGSSGNILGGPLGTSKGVLGGEEPVLVQEYSLRVPKTNVRPISIMRFNGALGIDPSKWTSVKMAREDNSKLHKTNFVVPDEEMPKFGAGSEYGREAREEARRRKYGLNRKKSYNPNEQPWRLKLGDKINRKYKGVREGGVSENASYFIFTQAPDGAFEVFPVQQWYNFTPIQRYKSLTSEEAEEQFGRRNKIMNYFSVMVRKRMKNEDDGDDEVVKFPGRKTGGKKAESELKMSEMDDWADSEDEEMSDDGEDEDEKEDKKKKNKSAKSKGKKGQKKKKKGSDEDDGGEDSDDGDEEGRELDYISDTTETESEDEKEKKADIQGVDQEQALRHLLDSGSDSDEDGEEKKEEEDEGEDEPGPSSKNNEEGEPKDKKKKKKKKTKSDKKDNNNAENLSDDDDVKGDNKDETDASADASVKIEPGSSGSSGNLKDGITDMDNIGTSSNKRKANSDLVNFTGSNKKPKMEVSPVLLQSATAEGITEEAVRRYLLRKPMTVTELLHKFKSKKTKISSQDMVNVIAHILKKINPVKRVQNQKMYLYLTATKS